MSKRLFAPQDKTLRRTRWFQNPKARSELELGYVAVTSRVHYPLQYGARESASRWAFLARYTWPGWSRTESRTALLQQLRTSVLVDTFLLSV